MGMDGILFQVYLDCHYYCQPDMHTGELYVLDPVNLLEICGLHVLYISSIRRTTGTFIILPVGLNNFSHLGTPLEQSEVQIHHSVLGSTINILFLFVLFC